MNANYRQKHSATILTLVIFMLLWHPLSFSPLAQGGGAGTAGSGEGGGVTMQAVTGRVIETMNSGGYTYAMVEGAGGRTWVALPKSRIAVGDEIVCRPGMVMNNFTSTSLNRTFKQIVFSGGLTSSPGGTAPPAAIAAPDEAPPAPRVREPENWKDF